MKYVRVSTKLSELFVINTWIRQTGVEYVTLTPSVVVLCCGVRLSSAIGDSWDCFDGEVDDDIHGFEFNGLIDSALSDAMQKLTELRNKN